MKFLLISFSARAKGNCFHCLSYCAERLRTTGHETRLLNLSDFSVSCCNRCRYECFNTPKSCPLPDDMRTAYKKLMSDRLIGAVPTYGGHAAGLYRAFMERMQMMAPEFQAKQFLQKTKSLIVIGNRLAGGDKAFQEVASDFYAQLPEPEFLLLSAREFNRRAIDGDLIESADVKTRLDSFIDRL